MFLDGLMYAAIAKNLAMGQGEFWNLFYTDTFYTQFNEHPPLVFGLQSLAFSLFGDHLWVERWYSLGTYFLISGLMYKIWTFLGKSKSTFWLPMLFLSLIPLMTWSTANNMLENTMSIFTCATVYFYLRSTNGSRYFFLILSSSMVLFAFLSKGFTGLYVLVFPLSYSLFSKQKSSVRGFLDSLFIAVLSVTMLLIIFYVNDDSLQALSRYYDRQVVGSLEHVVTVKSRFYILSKLLTELLIPIGLILLVFLWIRKRKEPFNASIDRSQAFAFFALGLCGVLPIIISLKQSGFYIVTTFPFFAIALALFTVKSFVVFQHDILLNKLRLVQIVCGVLLVGTISLYMVFANRIGRDKEKIVMIQEFDTLIRNDEIVFIPEYMWSDWNIHAYFSRFKNVSLSAEAPSDGALFLSKSQQGDDFELTLQSGSYFLYRKKQFK